MSTRSFTEAVPLSLSSMAHISHPLEEGVLDGLRQVLQHTLLSCVNYARVTHRTHEWTLHDLGTSEFAWLPCKGEQPPSDLLTKYQENEQIDKSNSIDRWKNFADKSFAHKNKLKSIYTLKNKTASYVHMP